jgi:UDP-N-acetylmuramate dehydrogenase
LKRNQVAISSYCPRFVYLCPQKSWEMTEIHPEENVSLKPYHTFGMEVKARHFARFHSIEALKCLILLARQEIWNLLLLGGGSNVLFLQDFDGLVLLNQIKGISESPGTNGKIRITAGAGENWNDLVNYCVMRGYGGIENLALIPGTCGAAPMQNIGAYGMELKDTFYSLEALHLHTLEPQIFHKADCNFGYRTSYFKEKGRGLYCITSITLEVDPEPVLQTGYAALKEELTQQKINNPSIQDIRDAVVRIRTSKLPDPAQIGNAGSFFKNPEVETGVWDRIKASWPEVVAYPVGEGRVKLAAGWLIEQAGWKGYREGDIGVHEKQALVLVNYGGGKGSDIAELAQRIQHSVRTRFGVLLEPEVNWVGRNNTP